jgi:hypothetical protein
VLNACHLCFSNFPFLGNELHVPGSRVCGPVELHASLMESFESVHSPPGRRVKREYARIAAQASRVWKHHARDMGKGRKARAMPATAQCMRGWKCAVEERADRPFSSPEAEERAEASSLTVLLLS